MIAWDHWHIEPSSICALRCPRCPRVEVAESLLDRQLSLQFFCDQIGIKVIQNIKKITFCGNDGDPIYCKELIEICEWLKKGNPSIHLVIVTNGSRKSESWWTRLGQVLDHFDEIHWSIDGWDQDSNEQYRVSSNWQSIMQGIQAFATVNKSTYRTWATIAFSFNQNRLADIQAMARSLNFDCFQLTKSTKFASHYPQTYGPVDDLCPSDPNLISSDHRFQRLATCLTARDRPSDQMKPIFLHRARALLDLDQHGSLCRIGNKGLFVNSRGELYPCCWTANRYQHNLEWIERARDRFNLHTRTFADILADEFWTTDFLRFESEECQTKCPTNALTHRDHVTEW